MEILTDDELLNKSKEELVELVKLMYNKLLEKPKTSEAQLKAIRNYNKTHPETISKIRKQYYDKMKQDSNWVEEKNRLRRERYNQKKIAAITNN
jgi:hypothetical protein